jgi:hypothetical protein
MEEAVTSGRKKVSVAVKWDTLQICKVPAQRNVAILMQLGVQRTCDEAEIDILDRPNGKPIEVAVHKSLRQARIALGWGLDLDDRQRQPQYWPLGTPALTGTILPSSNLGCFLGAAKINKYGGLVELAHYFLSLSV